MLGGNVLFTQWQIYCGFKSAHLLCDIIHQIVQRWSAVNPQGVHAWSFKRRVNMQLKTETSWTAGMLLIYTHKNILTLYCRVCVDVSHSSILQQFGIILLRRLQ